LQGALAKNRMMMMLTMGHSFADWKMMSRTSANARRRKETYAGTCSMRLTQNKAIILLLLHITTHGAILNGEGVVGCWWWWCLPAEKSIIQQCNSTSTKPNTNSLQCNTELNTEPEVLALTLAQGTSYNFTTNATINDTNDTSY
jgi:hypothetical protein